MQEIMTSIVVPILTALIAYLGARHQSNKEIEKLRIQHESDLEKIERKIKAETDAYEQTAQVDIAKGIFESDEIKELIVKEAVKKLGK